MAKRKVLFVAHHLTIGGVQKSLVSALNFIDYKSNDVTLYLRNNRLDLLPYINKNVKVIINTDPHHYYRFPYAILLQTMIKLNKCNRESNEMKLAQYIHDKQMEYEKKHYFTDNLYDVAIAYNEGYTAEFVMDYVTAKRKVMFFQSSTDSKHEVHRRIMPQFDSIVVEHKEIRNSLTAWYKGISEKIRIIENYTDYKFIRDLSREMYIEKDDNAFILCTCSRFSPEKGLDLAVKSARILHDSGINFKWYLVGDGPERKKIELLVEKNQLHNNIVIPGMQKNPYPYMADCDIYVQPSREEALSIAMLESQVLCTPMVSTNTAGGLAMIQDGINGLLADINAESLAEKIERLINNEKHRKDMKTYLESIDYSKEEKRYRKDWETLLCEKYEV